MWNEARRDYFFDPNVTLWGHFFALAQNTSKVGPEVPKTEATNQVK